MKEVIWNDQLPIAIRLKSVLAKRNAVVESKTEEKVKAEKGVKTEKLVKDEVSVKTEKPDVRAKTEKPDVRVKTEKPDVRVKTENEIKVKLEPVPDEEKEHPLMAGLEGVDCWIWHRGQGMVLHFDIEMDQCDDKKQRSAQKSSIQYTLNGLLLKLGAYDPRTYFTFLPSHLNLKEKRALARMSPSRTEFWVVDPTSKLNVSEFLRTFQAKKAEWPVGFSIRVCVLDPKEGWRLYTQRYTSAGAARSQPSKLLGKKTLIHVDVIGGTSREDLSAAINSNMRGDACKDPRGNEGDMNYELWEVPSTFTLANITANLRNFSIRVSVINPAGSVQVCVVRG